MYLGAIELTDEKTASSGKYVTCMKSSGGVDWICSTKTEFQDANAEIIAYQKGEPTGTATKIGTAITGALKSVLDAPKSIWDTLTKSAPSKKTNYTPYLIVGGVVAYLLLKK